MKVMPFKAKKVVTPRARVRVSPRRFNIPKSIARRVAPQRGKTSFTR
jgi:hypothetical protein